MNEGGDRVGRRIRESHSRSIGSVSEHASPQSGRSRNIASVTLCPEQGCLSAARRETDGLGLDNHVDAHLLGQLPGLPSEPG